MENVKSKMKTGDLKVALVCDWLTGTGGAERVVLELHKLFPEAPIYTSQYDDNPKLWHGESWFKDADIHTTWLQKLPKSLRKFFPPLRAFAFSRLNLSGYDLVISASGSEAKGVRTTPKSSLIGKFKINGKRKLENGKSDVKRAFHICYVHAPTHYYWSRYDDYLKNPGFGRLDPIARIGLKLLVGPLRKWDYAAAQRPDFLIANSTHTQIMIKKYYGRDSTVIFPPVDINRFRQKIDEPRRGFVTTGRQTPYMRRDLAVKACSKLNLPLLVLGNGPEHKKLRRVAGRSVTFIKRPSDEQVAYYLQTSLAFIFPGLEDFGITAVEAMAAGTPVIAYRGGGALDTVEDGKTGLFFDKQDADSLVKALEKFSPEKFNSEYIREHTKKFSDEVFHRNMKDFIKRKVG